MKIFFTYYIFDFFFLSQTVQKRLEEERKHDRPRDKHDRPRPTASRFSNLKNRRTMPVKRIGTSLSTRYNKFGGNTMTRSRGRGMQRGGINRSSYNNMGSSHGHGHVNRSRCFSPDSESEQVGFVL